MFSTINFIDHKVISLQPKSCITEVGTREYE